MQPDFDFTTDGVEIGRSQPEKPKAPVFKALLLVPTHADAEANEEEMQAKGMNAVAYRGRFSEGDDQNCWNTDADEAERIGLPVTSAVCPMCSQRKDCLKYGYLESLQRASSAQIGIATHARAIHQGTDTLAAGCSLVNVDENAVEVLRPLAECSEKDLRNFAAMLNRLLNDPRWLNWFGETTSRDDDGLVVPDEKLAERRTALFEFIAHMAKIVDHVLLQFDQTKKTSPWNPASTEKKPSGTERLLFRAVKESGTSFDGSPLRLLLGISTGATFCNVIAVDSRFKRGNGSEKVIIKRLVGVWNNTPDATNATVIYTDATADEDILAEIIGQRIRNITPTGRLALRKKAVQIVSKDISRGTRPKPVQAVLRGVIADRPQFKRIGVICHSNHVAAVKSLEPDFASKIAKVAYFGSGEDRSSNEWHKNCDLLIVLGTPRIPPAAVRTWLIRVGKLDAAEREPEWSPLYWTGRNESGEPCRVKGSGYARDIAWRQAHRCLVRANLVQAVGRGRGILEDGCEVVVVSNEECGLTISDSQAMTVSKVEAAAMDAIKGASEQNSNSNYLEKCSVSTTKISVILGISSRRCQTILSGLEARGLICRVGQRGGWRSLPPGNPSGEATETGHHQTLALARQSTGGDRPSREACHDGLSFGRKHIICSKTHGS